MKVVLKKDVEDEIYVGYDEDQLELNPISRALTRRYLPRFDPSPLKTMFLHRFGTVKDIYLHLKVACEENTHAVKTIALDCNLLDDYERTYQIDKVDWESVDSCMDEYFQSIGYDKIRCTEDEDIVNFVLRLQKDIPLVKDYLEVKYNCDENIARIGFMGEKSEYEVYVQTDDEVSEPHFHVRDAETKGARFETCVGIETNRYCPHGDCSDELSVYAQERLMDFMKRTTPTSQCCSTPTSNYERVVDMWNLNNENTQVTLKRNERGDVVIPIYSEMEDRL